MLEELSSVLDLERFLPPGHSLAGGTPLIRTVVVSDLLIFLSYFFMPLALLHFGRRRVDFAYRWQLRLFAGAIFVAGLTHLVDVLMLWYPLYQPAAFLKSVVALVSVLSAVVLWPLLVRALKLPSPAQLRLANQELRRQIAWRERVEQAFRLVTDANHLLVHATDERRLLEDICQLVVDTGGYRMAWVGFAEDDAGKTVRPAAHAGQDDGYLDTLPHTWDDTPLGRSPAGRAIRSAAAALNQDTEHDPDMQPWRDAALQRGYRASIALPLVGQGRTLGALSIYAAEPQAFWPREVKLLEELARNFAYGIETLRARALKNETDQELENHRRNLEALIAQRTSELSAAKCEAENANNAKSHFLAAASHDLRQPLSALSLYVGLLENKLAPVDRALHEGMRHCVASLNEMLSDLLDLSKLEAGAVTPKPCDFALDTILIQLLSAHLPEAELKGLRLRCSGFGVIGHTDPVLFQRILGNLLANAIRYTACGGVLIGCRHRQGRLWVEVWDTGIGIPADKTAEIFEEFKQLANDERNRAKGSGLGLAIVAKTAALLGLQISVRSRLGKGSVFGVELPLGQSLPHLQQRPYAHRPLRIALVEDNPEVAAALVYSLNQVGHEVVAAASRPDILTLLDKQAPDIVISDFRLSGGENGFDVIAALRRGFGKQLPALIITGDTDPAVIRRMSRNHISVQHKPLDLNALREKIAELTA